MKRGVFQMLYQWQLALALLTEYVFSVQNTTYGTRSEIDESVILPDHLELAPDIFPAPPGSSPSHH